MLNHGSIDKETMATKYNKFDSYTPIATTHVHIHCTLNSSIPTRIIRKAMATKFTNFLCPDTISFQNGQAQH